MTSPNIPQLLKKYDRPVPRYTSYPTAVHFNDHISQEKYREQINSLANDTPVSLYVHIPFCHILCHYCGCHTKVANSYRPLEAYVKTLLKEIDLVGDTLSHRLPVSQLHFGGGSPNFLASEDIKRIIDTLSRHFDFGTDTEIAMETDPRLLDKEKIKDLSNLGFTRISLGVQDFDPAVQKAVNRIQPFETVKNSVDDLRSSGIHKINFDLMIGLPLQTLEIIKDNVEKAISLSPDRLSIFSYAHVPWMKKHQTLLEKYPMPDTQMRFDMMTRVKETLEKAHYYAIGIDHFAREDDSLYQSFKTQSLRRNFQGYTDDSARNIIGFGLSSISSFDGMYVQNTTDAAIYRNTVDKKIFPVTRGCILTKDDKQRRSVIESIMCGYKTNISAYPQTHAALADLAYDGIITLDESSIQVTEKGWPFARIVAACFDTYYTPKEGQHAKAV